MSRRRQQPTLLGLLVLVAVTAYALWSRQEQQPAQPSAVQPVAGALTISFLDVGQGDAVLVVSPDGKSMLYDAGRSQDDAARLLAERGITRLDLAVASHADADHISGFEQVAKQFKPRYFLNNGIASTTRTYGRVVNAMKAAGAQGLVASERSIKLGENVDLTVLPPPPGMPKGDQNSNAVGVLVRFGNFKAFLGGDAEPATTSGWASLYGKQLAGVPVYKALHHGSRNNDTLTFLRLIKPRDVFVGVGAGNSFGHPTREALALYRKVGARVHRTDLNGTITVTANNDGTYSVREERSASDAELNAPGS